VLDRLGRDPHLCGHDQSRWTLAALQAEVAWLRGLSRSGVSRLLRRLGITRKRSRAHVHSPDPDYLAKQAALRAAIATAQRDPDTVVCLLDEVTLGRHPTNAPAYAARGRRQPLARRGLQSDTAHRVVAALDVRTGQVHWRRRSAITVATLVGFFRDLVAAYGGRPVVVVLDNWPVHFHPDLLAALVPQTTPYRLPRPGHWPTEPSAAARAKWGHLRLPIQFLPLPTYASWLNPIEKLWRWLRQTVVHLHPWAGDLAALWLAVAAFLDRFAAGSPDLLRYVGLAPPD
jgi:hypothetical protein